MSDMMTRIAVVAAVVTGSATLASAQDFDPSGANRGYPQFAAPGGVHYYGGQLQGSRPGPVTLAIQKAYLDTVRGGSERWSHWLEYASTEPARAEA